MEDNACSFYILNGKLDPSEKPGQLDMSGQHAVYEVIRVIKGVPLFMEDHYNRMLKSLSLLNNNLTVSQEELTGEIRKLAIESKLRNFNAKVTVFQKDNTQNLLLYVSNSYYPGSEEITAGVNVSLLNCERANPNAKVIDKQYKEMVNKKMEDDKAFEVLLVNRENRITEGSRSNVFFIRDGKAYTAPGEYVLKGITRQYVFEACKRAGVEVVEKLLDVEELNRVEGAFLSGTSIKVLPISAIGSRSYDSSKHPLIAAIRDQFDDIIDNYVKVNAN